MEKTEKKRLDREAAKDKQQYAIRTVEALMATKLARQQKQRVERSDMSPASKFAKVGDEFNLRVELEEGYPVDDRDGVVRKIYTSKLCGYYSFLLTGYNISCLHDLD